MIIKIHILNEMWIETRNTWKYNVKLLRKLYSINKSVTQYKKFYIYKFYLHTFKGKKWKNSIGRLQ